MRNTALIAALTAFGLVLVFTLPARAEEKNTKKIQCWTEENGRRACGDRVPPKYAKQERQVYDKRGVVVETKPREPTPEERAEQERKKQEAIAAQKQVEYDRFLLQTYRNVKELQSMRDERLGTVEGRLKLAEKAVADNEKTLTDLQGRADNLKAKNKDVDPKLSKQIKDYTKSLAENRKAIEQLKQEREDIGAQFNRDIARYQQLKSGQVIPAAGATKP